MILDIIFWFSLFIVFYTYLGYGILILFLVKIKELLYPDKSVLVAEFPDVTLLIAAYNEEDVIVEKMNNIALLDYPKDKLDIVWVTDGSTDKTISKLESYTNIKVLFEPERKGKTAAINRSMAFINTPIVIFTDANAMLNPESIKRIVSPFSNSQIGCVAGEKRIIIQSQDTAVSSGEGFYWRYESFLKNLDSRLYSVVGAAGELYAIRRNLFTNIPNDTLLDDFVLSLKIAQKGYRIAYCPLAYAVESGSESIQEEEKRKIRIAAGGLQAIWRLHSLLNIFQYRTLSFQYISHRVLRWAITPLVLFSLLPLNALLCIFSDPSYTFLYYILFLAQCMFYLLAFFGYIGSKKEIKNKILFIPYYFIFMNLNTFKAYSYILKKEKLAIWEKSRRKSTF